MRQKLRRLREEKDTRRLIAVILGGKMLGIVGVLGAMKAFAWLFESAAWAQSAAPIAHKANDFVSPINTVWVLVTAFLVFFMQAGFMGLEAGFARSRETVNVLLECVFDTCLCGLLYWATGSGVRAAGSVTPWGGSTAWRAALSSATSRARRSCTLSAGSLLWPAPSPSGLASAECSSGTVAARCLPTTSRGAPSAASSS